MKRVLVAVIGLIVIAFGGYLFLSNGENNNTKVSEAEDIKQLVEDYSTDKIQDGSASITSEQLIVTDSKKNQEVYNLPEDEMFVSIAPYINKTHSWSIHNLTGCQGELVGQEFKVVIEDTEGNVVVDETLTSYQNGFIDLWLPRDKKFKVTISQDGRKAETEISTFENDNTCVTTMQLA